MADVQIGGALFVRETWLKAPNHYQELSDNSGTEHTVAMEADSLYITVGQCPASDNNSACWIPISDTKRCPMMTPTSVCRTTVTSCHLGALAGT